VEGEQVNKPKGKSTIYIVLIVVLLFMILVLLFLISPLKNLIFPVAEEPQLTLVVVESAAAADESGRYRVLVEAIVAGNPEPQLQFNRNDGIGQVEPNFSLVLLVEEETFLLTAVATNEEGSAEASLELYPGIAVGTASEGSDSAGIVVVPDSDTDDEDVEPEADPSDPGPDPADPDDNNAPELEAIFYEGDDISDLVFRSESLPVRYAEGRHSFVVIAADRDDDAIDFDLAASHGRLVDVTRVAVDSVAFTWLSPANPAGNLEALNVIITVTASDPSGATDRQQIRLALLPDVGELEPESMEVTITSSAVQTLSGYISAGGLGRTEVVLVGDNAANEMYKGYLTFNIGLLTEVAPEDIVAARIRFIHINKSGRPESFATWVDFKEFNYGDSLDERDFAVGGTLFYRQRAESFGSGTIIQGSLITQIRQAIGAGRNRFQVKMGLDAGTNSNGADDFFQFRPENVELEITIIDRLGRFREPV
jgi:hypothetical protein